jgi:hypothetical protein
MTKAKQLEELKQRALKLMEAEDWPNTPKITEELDGLVAKIKELEKE